MSNRLVAVQGSVALVAGSKGISTYGLPGLTKIGSADGYFSDVDFIGDGQPVGILIKMGNPATASLRIFGDEGLSGSYDRPSFNPPALGRIDGAESGDVFWAQGTRIRREGEAMPGRVVDTGSTIHDIGATFGAECVIASGNRVICVDTILGGEHWSASLPTQVRFLVTNEKYVVAWGAGVFSGGALMIPVTVLDADTGVVVTTLNQTGGNLISCAALSGDYLYVGKPKYVTGQAPAGQIEVYNLANPQNAAERAIDIARPPLALATDDSGGCVWVNSDPGYVTAAELGVENDTQPTAPVDLDPYTQFVDTTVMTPKERAVMDMINAFAPQATVMSYNAILAALRG